MAWNRGEVGRLGAVNGEAATFNGGTIQLRTGVPNDPDNAASGTLLGTGTFGTPAFASATDDGTTATATANAITPDSSADATGTAGHFRCYDSGGSNCIGIGSVGLVGSGADMELSSVDIVALGTINFDSFLLNGSKA